MNEENDVGNGSFPVPAEADSQSDFADSELNYEETNLSEEIGDGEEEFPPPEEENEAREINVGTIIGVIFIFLIVVIMIIMFFGGRKKKTNTGELDKAGSKYELDFEKTAPAEVVIEENFGKDAPPQPPVDDKNVDDILDTLPASLQPQPVPDAAPVAPVGGQGGKSERPDTRNSKSPRRIDGLKGQAPGDTNQNIVSAMMSGNQVSSANQRMTKEEYIAQMMKQTQALQNQIYGGGASGAPFGSYGTGGNGNQAAAYQQNREQFYSNGSENGGSGQYLSYNTLWDGTIISGALVTAINTDNPGVVIARVTENVYSSYDHSFLLIPEGSTLYATYNSSVSYGQNKVQVAWNLLIRPDGYRMTLGNMNGVGADGMSGYRGRVNNHPFETLKALGMVAVYSLIQTELTHDINSTKNEYIQNAMTDVYSQAAKIGNKIIDRALDIKPTITIKAGTEIKLITNMPLELPPVEIPKVTRRYVRTR